jgi:squalene cyclase
MATRKLELRRRVEQALAQGAEYLSAQQSEHGGFDLGFDGGALPDAQVIFLHHVLELDASEFSQALVRRLLDRQLPEGSWALAPGMAGHLSTTVEAYVALRAAGQGANERPLLRARRFIKDHGGLDAVRGPTRITLALLGLHSWPATVIPPPEPALLPPGAPVSLFRVGALLRLHLLPLVVLRALEATVVEPLGRALGLELGALPPSGASMSRLPKPGPLRGQALAACVRLMTERLDDDGTLGGLVLATGWAALAARAVGLPPDHPLVTETPRGLRSLVHADGRKIHVQVCRPTIRSTALALQALRAAGFADRNDKERKCFAGGCDYLQSHRAGEHGDFELLGPSGPVVAWSIKPSSRRFPSLLDTLLVVSALSGSDQPPEELRQSLSWVAAMQRPDGGFALFDRDAATAPWLRRLPLGLLSHTLNDESSPEVTGKVLEVARSREFLTRRQVDRALRFLGSVQRGDGSWQGPFSLGYLPATSAVLVGYASAGVRSSNHVQRAVSFLVERQREEGGWGESPESVAHGGYIDLGRCSASQTAAALHGLIAVRAGSATPAIERGISQLLWTQEPDGGWIDDDPTSSSLADVLHLRNPVERVARPLLALRAFLDLA